MSENECVSKVPVIPVDSFRRMLADMRKLVSLMSVESRKACLCRSTCPT